MVSDISDRINSIYSESNNEYMENIKKIKKAEIENSDAYQYFASFYNKNGKKI